MKLCRCHAPLSAERREGSARCRTGNTGVILPALTDKFGDTVVVVVVLTTVLERIDLCRSFYPTSFFWVFFGSWACVGNSTVSGDDPIIGQILSSEVREPRAKEPATLMRGNFRCVGNFFFVGMPCRDSVTYCSCKMQ